MKKKSMFFVILGSFLGLGIILTAIGIFLGGRLQSTSIRLDGNKGISVSSKPQNTILRDKDIRALNFNLAAGSIEIRRGDTFSIQAKQLFANHVHDGVWTVESRLTDHFHTINFFGIAQIPLPFHTDHDKNMDDIIITIPEEVSLDEIEMELSASSVNVEHFDARNIDLELSAGDLTIDSLMAKEADLSVSAGDITIKQYNISEEISLDCSVGAVTFGSRQNAENNICSNLEADCSMGDIDVYGKLTGECYLDCSMGSITANLVGSMANYHIQNSDSTFGSINYSTRKFTNKSGNSRDVSVSPDTDVYGTLNFDCSMGSIDICYLYASPDTKSNTP